MDSDTNSWHWQSHSSKWTLPSLHWPLKKQEMAPWRTVSRWGTQGEHHPQPRSRQPICASPKHYASCQQLTLFSHLSMHPFRYASWLMRNFFWQKSGFIFNCLNMSCRVICHECMNFLRFVKEVRIPSPSGNVVNLQHCDIIKCRQRREVSKSLGLCCQAWTTPQFKHSQRREVSKSLG